MIKKFVVILLLFSFALQIFPERVFAANYLLLSSDSLNRSSWTLNPGVAFGGQNNQRVVTQAITSGSTSIVAKWSSSITGEYKNSNTSQPGWWLLRLQEYSENGVSPSGFRNTDFYLEIRPNGASATSVPTPLTERTVEALVYKVGGVNSVPGIIATDDFVDSSNGTTSFFNVARGKYPWASGTPQTTYEKYISDTAMYLFSGNHPKLSIGSLPSAAIAACGTGTVKQDHLSNWALMDAITKTGVNFKHKL